MQEDFQIFPDKPIIYGSFWERVGASILDTLLLLPVSLGITYLLTGSIVEDSYFTTSSGINLVIYWLYDALQESSAIQGTLGKRALNLKVTDMQGDRISFARATGRHFGKYLSMIIIFIGYLMMIWDKKNQTLHDKMAGTLVVAKDPDKPVF